MNAGTRRGFTLLELVVSLGLVAVLVGLAAPGFHGSQRNTAVRAATLELLSGLQQVRASAILESRAALLCPADDTGVCLPAGSAGVRWRSYLEQGAARIPQASLELPAGVSLRASRSPLRFGPMAYAASTGTLTICDRAGIAEPRAIVISQTGRARLAFAPRGDCA